MFLRGYAILVTLVLGLTIIASFWLQQRVNEKEIKIIQSSGWQQSSTPCKGDLKDVRKTKSLQYVTSGGGYTQNEDTITTFLVCKDGRKFIWIGPPAVQL